MQKVLFQRQSFSFILIKLVLCFLFPFCCAAILFSRLGTEKWGTKWDARGSDLEVDDDQLYYSFDTAWGPPTDWAIAASALYPDLWLNLFYEGKMAYAGCQGTPATPATPATLATPG